MIRVAIVDDHAVVRQGLAQLLSSEDDIEVVGTATNGDEAHTLLSTVSPDVYLMDLSMPEVDGVEATRRIVADAPGVNVVVLTSFADRQRILDALEAGASGYLLKDGDPAQVADAIRAAAAGNSPLDPKAARVLLDARREQQPAVAAADRLTAREREVLDLVGQGLANKQIARRLGIAERTVKAHLTSVFQAIGVTDRTQAALWAQKNLSHEDGKARRPAWGEAGRRIDPGAQPSLPCPPELPELPLPEPPELPDPLPELPLPESPLPELSDVVESSVPPPPLDVVPPLSSVASWVAGSSVPLVAPPLSSLASCAAGSSAPLPALPLSSLGSGVADLSCDAEAGITTWGAGELSTDWTTAKAMPLTASMEAVARETVRRRGLRI